MIQEMQYLAESYLQLDRLGSRVSLHLYIFALSLALQMFALIANKYY